MQLSPSLSRRRRIWLLVFAIDAFGAAWFLLNGVSHAASLIAG